MEELITWKPDTRLQPRASLAKEDGGPSILEMEQEATEKQGKQKNQKTEDESLYDKRLYDNIKT